MVFSDTKYTVRTPALQLLTPTGCPATQFSSDANYPELQQPPQVKAEPPKTAPLRCQLQTRCPGYPHFFLDDCRVKTPPTLLRSDNSLEQLRTKDCALLTSLVHYKGHRPGTAQGEAWGEDWELQRTLRMHQPTSPQTPLPRDFHTGSMTQA